MKTVPPGRSGPFAFHRAGVFFPCQAGRGSAQGRCPDTKADTVRIWELGRQVDMPVLFGHTSYRFPVEYGADGQWIAAGGWEKTVRLWDVVSVECCSMLPHPECVPALALPL